MFSKLALVAFAAAAPQSPANPFDSFSPQCVAAEKNYVNELTGCVKNLPPFDPKNPNAITVATIECSCKGAQPFVNACSAEVTAWVTKNNDPAVAQIIGQAYQKMADCCNEVDK
ncbi:hypothetical protein HDU91_001123, partial [Kappamyces sp. JEL0680]